LGGSLPDFLLKVTFWVISGTISLSSKLFHSIHEKDWAIYVFSSLRLPDFGRNILFPQPVSKLLQEAAGQPPHHKELQ